MKKSSILLLLFFINCSSQQKVTDKKYMDMDAMIQKYRNIKVKYDSLVNKNKSQLINNYGVYFKKSSYEKEKQEKKDRWIDPLQSESVFLLKENDKAYFIKDQGETETIYTFQDDKLIEQASGDKKSNVVFRIDNLIDATAVQYNLNNNKIYLSHYIQDEYDQNKRDIMLDQEYVNNELVLERDFKRDFIISKEEMLKKLPNNFYQSAMRYIEKRNEKTPMSSESFERMSERINDLKQKLNSSIKFKDDFYKKINIWKTYNEDNYPLYHLSFPDNHIDLWELKIDGKTNEILNIAYEIPNA